MANPRPQSVSPTALADISRVVGAPEPRGADAQITGVTLDSRAVRPGDLYAALSGATTHGARFAGQAAQAGAVAILTDPAGASMVAEDGIEVPVLTVPDPRAVLGAASSVIYGTADLDMRLIAITGTNGKTTIAYLLHSALEELGQQAGLIGTVETRIGSEVIPAVRTTPEAPDVHAMLAVMAERGLEAAIMEVSSHALALHRVDAVVFDVAVFTNLTRDHLDFHGTMDDYFKAKAELFTPRHSRRAVIDIDDAWGARLAGEATVPVSTLGRAPGSTWRVDPEGPGRARLVGPPGTVEVPVALPGDFNVTNTALAAITLIEGGLAPQDVSEALRRDPAVPGRMERVDTGEPGLTAIVDYAHTPDAVRVALGALRAPEPAVLIGVLGAGGERDTDKRVEMGAAAAEEADIVIVTDDNPRGEDAAAIRAALIRGAQAAASELGREVAIMDCADRRQAIELAVSLARTNPNPATIAVLGKGHERGQDIGGTILPFDDRLEVRAALGGRGGGPA